MHWIPSQYKTNWASNIFLDIAFARFLITLEVQSKGLYLEFFGIRKE